MSMEVMCIGHLDFGIIFGGEQEMAYSKLLGIILL
jgi:hypothetical protein